MERLYETLLQSPLFQGVTLFDFNKLIGKLKWHFDKIEKGKTIVSGGEDCAEVVFVLSGNTSITTESPNGLFSVTEYTDKAFFIEPYSLFGLNSKYRSTYIAESDVTIGSFNKLSFITTVNDFLICRINILNILSGRGQGLSNRLWDDTIKNSFESKVIRFILLHCENTEGRKEIKIRVTDLSGIIGVSHVSISATLNAMEKDGFIKTARMRIIVNDVAKLVERYKECD